jgi:hypothetical protein
MTTLQTAFQAALSRAGSGSLAAKVRRGLADTTRPAGPPAPARPDQPAPER